MYKLNLLNLNENNWHGSKICLKKNLKSPIKLAGGWRFFENIIVLQKNKNKIYKKILNFNEFVELSNGCQNSKNKLEEIYHNLLCA